MYICTHNVYICIYVHITCIICIYREFHGYKSYVYNVYNIICLYDVHKKRSVTVSKSKSIVT